MRSISRARHAKPALHPTRTLLSTGLTAVLLPLALAGPAVAAPPAAAASAVAPVTSATSTSKATATMRISAPTRVTPGRHLIGVRLLADGRYYPNRYVRVEKTTSRGWVPVGRMLTDSAGLARGRFPITATTRVRAVYDGGATSTTGVSPQRAVTVVRPAVTSAGFRAKALQVALRQSGKPYRYGSTGPNSFDCSGLVGFAYRAAGKSLPRTSRAMKGATRPVSRAAAVPGDLVFMNVPGHVGIYAGGGKMVDAPRTGKNVQLRKIYASYTIHRVA